ITATPPGSRPRKISALASAIASTEPKYSRCGLDRGDDGDMRPHQARERCDLARVVHADFEHGEAPALRQARERERHPPVVVVRSRRGMGLAFAREHELERVLGAGLADRTGHRDYPRG